MAVRVSVRVGVSVRVMLRMRVSVSMRVTRYDGMSKYCESDLVELVGALSALQTLYFLFE